MKYKKKPKKKVTTKKNSKIIRNMAFSSMLVATIIISSIFDNYFAIFPNVEWLKLSFSYLFLWIFLELMGLYSALFSAFIAIFLEFWFAHLTFVPLIGYFAKFIAYFLFLTTSCYLLKIIKKFKKRLQMIILFFCLVFNTILISGILTFLNAVLFIPIYNRQIPGLMDRLKEILAFTFAFNIIQFTLIFSFSYVLHFSYFQKVLAKLKKNTYNLE